MNLEPGEQVGRYEILSFLGAGGMGQVYRAKDSQLGRDVAIKMLPTAAVARPDLVARFHQEARALGLLNHPNLVTVFDFGEHGDSFYIVLELLEGETLRDRLRSQGAFSQRRSIQYAIQIARGMAAAHERGIIHRDLKPENIFLTRGGGLKILDFGLAKIHPERNIFESEEDAPTLAGSSQPGMLIGTVGYIAPEQLRGEVVDHRADIFAFGGILHEMLTGQPAFKGTTAVATLSSVLHDDPPSLHELGIAITPGLDLIVQRCLEKRAEDRFQGAKDLAIALEALGSATDSVTIPFGSFWRTGAKKLRRVWPYVLAAIAFAAIGAYIWNRIATEEPAAFRQLTFRRGDVPAARFTPDGGIAYAAAWEGGAYELYSSRVDSIEARDLGIASRQVLSVSSTGDLALLVKANDFFGTLATVSISGGAPREITAGVVCADWSPDGAKLAIIRHTANGQNTVEYPIGTTRFKSATQLRDLRLSPDGTRLAFRQREARLGKAFAVIVLDADGRTHKVGDWNNAKGLAWAPGGKEIVFASNESGSTEIHAATPSGKVRLLGRFDGFVKLHDISRRGELLLTRDDYREGIMAHAPGSDRERDLSWFDGSGGSDLSADGKLLLLSEFGEAGGPNYAAYVRPMNGGPAVRISDGYGVSLSPDGTSALVILPGATPRLAIVPLGAGTTRLVERGDIDDYEFASWLPDGKAFVFTGRTAKSPMRIYRQSASGGPPAPIGPPDVRLQQPSRSASPDGKWLAVSGVDGSLVIMPSDGTGAVRKLALGGYKPVAWSTDGSEVFVYRESELPVKLYRANVESGALHFVRELMPADPAGVDRVIDVVVTPDDRAYAYGVVRNLSTLFLSTGWRRKLE
jgi:Tol biopolymer transport system component